MASNACNRRPVWLAAWALACAASCSAPALENRDGVRYNVLLITIDTLRADHLGVYGHDGIETPNIDALAGRGVRFERAYTTCPVTLPAHVSIHTGTYPPYHGVRGNGIFRVRESLRTLAESLKANDYATAAVVGAAVPSNSACASFGGLAVLSQIEGAGDVPLPDDLLERLRAPLPRERLVGHRWRVPSQDSGARRVRRRPGVPPAHGDVRLPLLPSGPDGVRRLPLRRAWPPAHPRPRHQERGHPCPPRHLAIHGHRGRRPVDRVSQRR